MKKISSLWLLLLGFTLFLRLASNLWAAADQLEEIRQEQTKTRQQEQVKELRQREQIENLKRDQQINQSQQELDQLKQQKVDEQSQKQPQANQTQQQLDQLCQLSGKGKTVTKKRTA